MSIEFSWKGSDQCSTYEVSPEYSQTTPRRWIKSGFKFIINFQNTASAPI